MNTIIIRSAGMVFAAFVAAAAVSAVLEIGIINVSQAQVTPGENPMCDPSDTHVNTTESKICGIPKTPSAAGPTTTGPPKPLSPSSPGSITPQEPIPGLP